MSKVVSSVHLACPACYSSASVYTSRSVSKTVRELFCFCRNADCQSTFRAVIEVMNEIVPSMLPDDDPRRVFSPDRHLRVVEVPPEKILPVEKRRSFIDWRRETRALRREPPFDETKRTAVTPVDNENGANAHADHETTAR